MRKLIVKQIDKYESKTFKGKVIYEYLFCLMVDDVKKTTLTVLGDTEKEYLLDKFVFTHSSQNVDLEVTQVTYEQHIKNNE